MGPKMKRVVDHFKRHGRATPSELVDLVHSPDRRFRTEHTERLRRDAVMQLMNRVRKHFQANQMPLVWSYKKREWRVEEWVVRP